MILLCKKNQTAYWSIKNGITIIGMPNQIASNMLNKPEIFENEQKSFLESVSQ